MRPIVLAEVVESGIMYFYYVSKEIFRLAPSGGLLNLNYGF
jgi:hypothetical protein